MSMHHQRGFTLIEIMMAVAILAIIAAIAIPLYEGYILEARASTAIKDIRQMEFILDDLAADNDLRAFDANNAGLFGVHTDAAGNLIRGNNAAACPPPANVFPRPWCDPWGQVYLYQRADNNTQNYVLRSRGPDTAGNTADDVVVTK